MEASHPSDWSTCSYKIIKGKGGTWILWSYAVATRLQHYNSYPPPCATRFSQEHTPLCPLYTTGQLLQGEQESNNAPFIEHSINIIGET